MNAASPVPIMSLTSDIWTLIDSFLETNDAVRLISSGYKPFTYCLSRGIRTLRLKWSTSRYLEFGEVISTLNRFLHIEELHFKAPKRLLYLWKSPTDPLIPLASFPATLRSLDLSFVEALYVFRRPLGSALPCLTSMNVQSTRQKSPIDLQSLPRALKHLHINTRYASIVVQHLADLPPQLETLSLDFNPLFITQAKLESDLGYDKFTSHEHERAHHASLDSNPSASVDTASDPNLMSLNDDSVDEKEHLPILPDSLTHLYIKSHFNWHIDFATLPRSLTHFQYGGNPAIQGPDCLHGTSMDMTQAANRLPHLKTLDASLLELSFNEIVTLVPPSTTRLNCDLSDEDESYSPQATEFLKTRLSSLRYWPITPLTIAALGGTTDFSGLLHLDMVRRTNEDELETVHLPKNLQSIRCLRSNFDSLPPRLKSLHVRSMEAHETLTLGSHLTSLEIPAIVDIQTHHLATLPPTLTTISACFSQDVWTTLIELMLIPSRLPNLYKVSCSGSLPLQCIRTIPPQLRKLCFGIAATSLHEFEASPDESLLTSLSTSNITLLALRSVPNMLSTGESIPQMTATIKILNALPKGLKTLELTTPCCPSPYWPVSLPPKLNRLSIEPALYQPSQFYNHVEDGAPLFVFPVSIHDLTIQRRFSRDWTTLNLPPNLSNLTFYPFAESQIVEIEAYFDSRKPPPQISSYELLKP